MTNAELAELRGEIYGLKILLGNCLGFIAAITDDADLHLQEIQNQAIAGIENSMDDRVKSAHLQTMQAAAAGLVLQLIESAKVGAQQVERPRWLQ